MGYRDNKYPDDKSPASGFKASDKLNAAFAQAQKDEDAKLSGCHPGVLRLDEHPKVMRLFLTELLEQWDKDGGSKTP